jgi:hypothetical protein
MTPKQLVPGIEKYPDLEASMAARIPTANSGCSKCGTGQLAASYLARLKARLERDKWLRKP